MSNKIEIQMECPECHGNGFTEVGPECSYPASECCGGCYHREPCECDGGEISISLCGEEALSMIMSVVNGNLREAQELINEIHSGLCQEQ